MSTKTAAERKVGDLLNNLTERARGTWYGRNLQQTVTKHRVINSRMLKQYGKKLHILGFSAYDLRDLKGRLKKWPFSQQAFCLIHQDYEFEADRFNWRIIHLCRKATEETEAERVLTYKIHTKAGKITGFEVLLCSL